MRAPQRSIAGVVAVCAALIVVSAAASTLYEYTDDELSGPEQPIEFSHKLHAAAVADGGLGIECLYCHGAAEKGPHASVPAVSVCMGCHTHVASIGGDADDARVQRSAEEIQKLRDYYARGESIPWQKIHNLAEYVQFKHQRHVQAGVECQTCHGPVQEMNRVWLVPDTVLRPYSGFLPAAKLEMGWCMECHLERGASDECSACHY